MTYSIDSIVRGLEIEAISHENTRETGYKPKTFYRVRCTKCSQRFSVEKSDMRFGVGNCPTCSEGMERLKEGARFGSWTVAQLNAGTRIGETEIVDLHEAICDCGHFMQLSARQLRGGKTCPSCHAGDGRKRDEFGTWRVLSRGPGDWTVQCTLCGQKASLSRRQVYARKRCSCQKDRRQNGQFRNWRVLARKNGSALVECSSCGQTTSLTLQQLYSRKKCVCQLQKPIAVDLDHWKLLAVKGDSMWVECRWCGQSEILTTAQRGKKCSCLA